MKLDAHVHTHHSGNTTIYPVHRILRESYNTPEQLYRVAKKRGMDLVTITDHNSISGVLTIADRPDVIVGCEVSAIFADDKTECHIGVLGITEEQFREIQKLRHNARELMPYLAEQQIFCSLNHLASQAAGRLTAAHIAVLLPWLDAIETRNGSRLPSQNRTASALAAAHGKTTVGGSDSHTYRGIGATYMCAEGVRTREEFLNALRRGKVRAAGAEGSFLTLASDILRLAARFYADGVSKLIANPTDWTRYLMTLCSTVGMPLASIAVGGAFVHYLQEERFNRELVVALLAESGRPRTRRPIDALELAS